MSQVVGTTDQMASTHEQHDADRAKTEQILLRQKRSAEVLVKMAVQLNARLDLESVMNAVCEETARAVGVPAASLRLWDDVSDSLYYACDYGLPPESRSLALPIPRAVYDDYIARMGSIIVLSEVRLFPDIPDARRFAILGIRTAVITNMLREGRLVGSLNIYSFDERHFEEDELKLLQGLAHLAALAVANARLYDALAREERVRARLLQQALTTQEDERKRIARELHDETSQCVTAIVVGLEAARLALKGDLAGAEEHIESTKSIARQMLENVYRLVGNLRPSVLDDLGLASAILSFGEQRLNQLGITLRFVTTGFQKRLPPVVETALFRIFQEAMTNLIRYSQASTALVQLFQQGNHFVLRIIDDGKGFDLQSYRVPDSSGRGLGLRGMQERATMLGGELLFETTPGQGTTITVRIPLCNDEVEHV